jgi:hypothetical protein
MSDLESIVESFKDLSDLELEIMFVDGVCKKLKQLDKQGVRSETLLFMYMSIIETLKKFKDIAHEGKRSIPHEDAIDLTISRGEAFLKFVANDESQVPYVSKSLSDMYSFVKELMWMLKKELTDTPEYAHLKPS